MKRFMIEVPVNSVFQSCKGIVSSNIDDIVFKVSENSVRVEAIFVRPISFLIKKYKSVEVTYLVAELLPDKIMESMIERLDRLFTANDTIDMNELDFVIRDVIKSHFYDSKIEDIVKIQTIWNPVDIYAN